MSTRRSAANGGASSPSQDKAAMKQAQDKQTQLLSADVGHFSMVRALHLADFVTTLNGFCGIMSIFSSMTYLTAPGSVAPLWTSLTLMPLGLFFDFFDGRVARWRGKSSLMGQELDSLADLISFGAAPASFAFAAGCRSLLDRLALTMFVLCGLLRLARFNVTVQTLPKDKTGKSKYFEGTPIPTSLWIMGVFGFWVAKGWVGSDNLPLGIVGAGNFYEFHPIVGLFVVHGCLMISKTLKIPKP